MMVVMMKTMTDNDYKKILRTHGLKATSARTAVLSYFSDNKRPVSVQQIHDDMLSEAPNVVTLYRMMQDFLEHDLVRRVDLGGECALFENALHAHHHHIVCLQCGHIEDIEECRIEQVITRIAKESTTFSQIEEHTFELFGLCDRCRLKRCSL